MTERIPSLLCSPLRLPQRRAKMRCALRRRRRLVVIGLQLRRADFDLEIEVVDACKVCPRLPHELRNIHLEWHRVVSVELAVDALHLEHRQHNVATRGGLHRGSPAEGDREGEGMVPLDNTAGVRWDRRRLHDTSAAVHSNGVDGVHVAHCLHDAAETDDVELDLVDVEISVEVTQPLHLPVEEGIFPVKVLAELLVNLLQRLAHAGACGRRAAACAVAREHTAQDGVKTSDAVTNRLEPLLLFGDAVGMKQLYAGHVGNHATVKVLNVTHKGIAGLRAVHILDILLAPLRRFLLVRGGGVQRGGTCIVLNTCLGLHAELLPHPRVLLSRKVVVLLAQTLQTLLALRKNGLDVA
eukprot:PhM_4_TR8778/c0_g1_i1/m.88925